MGSDVKKIVSFLLKYKKKDINSALELIELVNKKIVDVDKLILEIIYNETQELDSYMVSDKKIILLASKRNISETEIIERLKILLKNGELYRPKDNFLKPTKRKGK